jgi:hypothetical protein
MSEQEHKILKVTSGVLEQEMPSSGIVSFIEDLIPRGIGFPIYQRLPQRLDETGYPIHQNPIVGFSGEGTLPLIGNPDSDYGAFAVLVIERKLVYESHGSPPHRLRDSYRWSSPPYHYYVDTDYPGVVKAFEESGYSIWKSLDRHQFSMAVFHGERFVLDEELTAGGIIVRETE